MLRHFLLLLSHSIFLTSSCPTGWRASTSINGKCYLFVSRNESWFQAEGYCRNAVTDGHLTSVSGAFENQELYADAEHRCDQYWIGLNDIEQVGRYAWIDGRPVQYTNWDAGQPVSDDDKRCVSVSGRNGGKWKAEYCGIAGCFFCETFQSSVTTTPSTPMTDCYDWYHIGGARSDGMYEIRVSGIANSFNVWCDMTTDGGGWTVFQRRINGDLSFYDKTWHDYKHGFNDGLNKNLWLGNEAIHLLSTKDSNVTLRIDVWGDRSPNSSYLNIYLWQKQSSFHLDSEDNYYTLHASKTLEGNASISGSPGWGINFNIGRPFSTIDNNHDTCHGCCTSSGLDLGGWWLYTCTESTLNGKYIPSVWGAYGFRWLPGFAFITPARSRMMLRKAT